MKVTDINYNDRFKIGYLEFRGDFLHVDLRVLAF